MTPPRRPAMLVLACAAVALLAAAPAAAVVPTLDGPALSPVVTMESEHIVRGLVTGPGGRTWDNVSVTATLVGTTVPAASSISYGGVYELLVAPGTYRIAFEDLSERVPVQALSSLVTVSAEQVGERDLGVQQLNWGTVTSSVAPAITGAPHVGSTLSVSPGTWTPVRADVLHTWLVGDRVIGEDESVRLLPAQLGKRVRVETLATRPGWLDGSTRATTVVIGRAPSVVNASGPARPVRRGSAARVVVVISDRSGTPVRGTVTLLEKGRQLSRTSASGSPRATRAISLQGLRPGVHVIVVKWSGSTYALPSSDTVRVTVRR